MDVMIKIKMIGVNLCIIVVEAMLEADVLPLVNKT